MQNRIARFWRHHPPRQAAIVNHIRRATAGMVSALPDGELVEFWFNKGLDPCPLDADPIGNLASQLRVLAYRCLADAERLEEGAR